MDTRDFHPIVNHLETTKRHIFSHTQIGVFFYLKELELVKKQIVLTGEKVLPKCAPTCASV